ncbi:MAG: DUF2071 domain-containing protein [Planctomycetota bacterium]
MQLPVIQGVIDRRILVNYRLDLDSAAAVIPKPFRPTRVHGYAIGGICLIRLKSIRPRRLPAWVGIGSENAAHRYAVEWDDDGHTRQGVYIPRRDTSSRLNALVGGWLFPGEHHHAAFTVHEDDHHLRVAFESDDGNARVSVNARRSDTWPTGSVFDNVDDASHFFEAGSLGYSTTQDPRSFDGLELRCQTWSVEPLDIQHAYSSHFENPEQFPPGSAILDCALLMRGIDHEWHTRNPLCC